jgi:hypothetical protein
LVWSDDEERRDQRTRTFECDELVSRNGVKYFLADTPIFPASDDG